MAVAYYLGGSRDLSKWAIPHGSTPPMTEQVAVFPRVHLARPMPLGGPPVPFTVARETYRMRYAYEHPHDGLVAVYILDDED